MLNTTETVSHFLKHGDSYGGQIASKVIEQSSSTVSVLVTIDNWSR